MSRQDDLLSRLRVGSLNLAIGTADLRTARALERRGLVTVTENRAVGGYDVRAIEPSRPVANGARFQPGDRVRAKSASVVRGVVKWCGSGPGACVGVESSADGSEWDFDVDHVEFDGPLATCSKARAEEIASCATGFSVTVREVIDALDRAQFFADPATLAEIARKASAIIADAEADNGELSAEIWRASALRLVKLVRKLGIGGGK